MNPLLRSLVIAASLLFTGAAIGEETSGPQYNKDNWEDFYPDLRDCDLREANLEGADLEDVKSGGIKGKPSSLPDYWVLEKKVILPNPDFLIYDFHRILCLIQFKHLSYITCSGRYDK